MADITITDRAAKYIDQMVDMIDKEKAAIADALTTASDAMMSPIDDDDEYKNLCAVLGRYNRLLTLITNC